jgi:hypothetical protein
MNVISGLICTALLTVGILLPEMSDAGPPTNTIAAFFAKIIPQVDHKSSSAKWAPAKKGGVISAGDQVKTGEGALAVIKFNDKSIVKVREKSELLITGEVDEKTVLKEVGVQKGVIGFMIGKQNNNEEFRFTSPTSVAAIRGTGGAFIVGPGSDTLVVTEGSIRFTNIISNESRDVGAGSTGIARGDGSLEVRASTQAEGAAAKALVEAGESENSLEFELQDGQGNKKKLKIDYRE